MLTSAQFTITDLSDGQTSYLHIAYATNATGTTGFSTTVSAGKTYIGQYTDFVAADSTTPSKYSWTLIKGDKGETGAAGRGIASTSVTYQVGSSGTSTPTGTWQSIVPTVAKGSYLWTKTVTTYTDSSTSTAYAIGYQGLNGANGTNGSDGVDGSDGRGISSTTVTYQSSTSGTVAPSGTWQSTVPTVAKGSYLWTKTVYTFTDATTQTQYSVGYVGTNGANGAAGASVKAVTNYYLASASSSGVTVSTSGWTTTIQTISASKPYLWNYEKVTNTNDAVISTTTPVIIGHFGTNGTNGSNGSDGISITGIVEHYAATSSNSVAPTTWYGTVQTMTATNKYLWNYETISYSDGSSDDTLKRVIGAYGDQGEKGDKGETGSQGIQGPPGANGVTYYTWLKYADTPTTGMSDSPTGKAYIGLAYNKTSATESTTYSDYTWSLIKGEKGDTGVKGATGANGVTYYTWIKYATNASGANMSDSPDGKTYIGIAYNKATAAESSTASDYTWSLIQGPKGDTGAAGSNGRGISTVTEYYLATSASSGVTISTAGWTTTVQTMTATKKYLWNYEVITYTTSETATIAPHVIGVYGNTGGTGATGNGISSVTNYYLATASSSGVTTSTTGWTTTVQSVSSSKKYLWNYEKVTFTNGSSSPTAPCIIGAYGDTGSTGAAGVSVTSVDVEYAKTVNSTVAPTSGWSTTAPAWEDGKYIWSRTKTVLSSAPSSPKYSTAVCITGGKGNTGSTGSTGATGKGVVSITEQYYKSTSKTTQTGGSWSTTAPTWESGKYIWTRSAIVYTDSSTPQYTTPACDSSWEAVNEIEVGGRNLLLETNQGKKNWQWAMASGGATNETVVEDGISCYKVTRDAVASSGWSYISYSKMQRSLIQANEKYTLSVDVKPSVSTSMNFHLMTGGGEYPLVTGWSERQSMAKDVWNHITVTFAAVETLPENNMQIVYIMPVDRTAGVSYVFKNIKLEKGNKATDWTPAPEDVDSKIEAMGSDVIVGTQTVVTGAWTGRASFSSLKDGQQITYWLPYNGSGNATLNLTLADGTTTGALPCYYSGTSRLTTHYAAGNAIHLTYRYNTSVSGSSTKYTGWWADANYYSDTYDRVRLSNAITAKSAVTGGRMIVSDDTGYYHLAAGVAFSTTRPILYAGSSISASATGTNNYLSISSVNLQSTKASWTGTAKKTCYL